MASKGEIARLAARNEEELIRAKEEIANLREQLGLASERLAESNRARDAEGERSASLAVELLSERELAETKQKVHDTAIEEIAALSSQLATAKSSRETAEKDLEKTRVERDTLFAALERMSGAIIRALREPALSGALKLAVIAGLGLAAWLFLMGPRSKGPRVARARDLMPPTTWRRA